MLFSVLAGDSIPLTVQHQSSDIRIKIFINIVLRTQYFKV
jgi:hypothetical protein